MVTATPSSSLLGTIWSAASRTRGWALATAHAHRAHSNNGRSLGMSPKATVSWGGQLVSRHTLATPVAFVMPDGLMSTVAMPGNEAEPTPENAVEATASSWSAMRSGWRTATSAIRCSDRC